MGPEGRLSALVRGAPKEPISEVLLFTVSDTVQQFLPNSRASSSAG